MTVNKTWTVMNDLQESFNQINTLSFLLDQLQEAVDEQNQMKIVDICYALNSFLPVYTENWDKNFKKAWDVVVE
jgi:hypothetical protein